MERRETGRGRQRNQREGYYCKCRQKMISMASVAIEMEITGLSQAKFWR